MRYIQIKYERVIIAALPYLPAIIESARDLSSPDDRYLYCCVKIHSLCGLFMKALHILLVRIFFRRIFDLGSSGSAGNICASALGSDGGVYRHRCLENFSSLFGSLGICIRYMLLLMRTDS